MMAPVSFPARCAVAVVCGEYLVSQVYPASVPIEAFLDSIVELVNDDLKRRGATAFDTGTAYELQRANGTRLDAGRTLEELGVEDGDTLVLVRAEAGESFEPHYEALSSGLAAVGRRLFPPVTAATAELTAVAVLGMVVVTMLGLALRARTHTDSWVPAIALFIPGVLLGFSAFGAWRWWPTRLQTRDGLAWLTIPLLAAGLAAAPPGPFASAHLFIAALSLAGMSWVLAAITGRHTGIASAVVTLCGIGAAVAAVRMWQPVASQRLAMLTLVGLLVLLTASPTIALWAARIRPPHFGSITGRDLFRRDDGLPVDAVAPVDQGAEEDAHPDPSPTGAAIAQAALRANGILTGICIGAAVVLPVAVWATLMPGQPKGIAAAILVQLFVLIFLGRARAFAYRGQAVALVCGAAAAFCAGVARYVVHSAPAADYPLLWGCLVLAGFGMTGLAAALLVPVTPFTPVVRMLTEWFELVAIVLALPLAAWVSGLFEWVRMR